MAPCRFGLPSVNIHHATIAANDNFRGIALQGLRLMRAALLACLVLLPDLAWAMRQCPPEFGEKTNAFWLLGWAIFGLFVITGILLPVLMFRATRQAPRLWRWWLRLASFPAMVAMWILGFGIFLGEFVLSC
jgi:hypothetical protein